MSSAVLRQFSRLLSAKHCLLRITCAGFCVLFVRAISIAQVTAIPSGQHLASDVTQEKTPQQWLAELGSERQAVAAHPGSAEAWLALGRALHALGNTPGAEQAINQALKRNPELSDALIERGVLLADDAKWPEAARSFQRAVAVTPRSPDAHLWLGDMLLRTGDFAAATREFALVEQLDPKNSGACRGMGLVSEQQGDFAEAVAGFRKSLSIRPDDLDTEEDLAHALAAERQWPQAARLLEHILAARPNSAAEQDSLGTVLERMGDHDAARKQFARAHELSDRQLILLRAEGDNNWGVELRAKGQTAAAEAAFRRAIQEDTGFCEAHDNLGSVLWMRQDSVAAMPEFEVAIHCDPHLASAYNNLGMALLEVRHNLTGATAQFRTAVALQPGFALAHLNLAKALAARQDFAAAQPEFRSAIALDPGMAAAHVGLGLVLAAEKGELSVEARAELKKGLTLDPSLRVVVPQTYMAQLH